MISIIILKTKKTMETNTIDFLQKIADKLNTTVEKINDVLLKQVKIDAIMSALEILYIAVAALIDYKLWMWIKNYWVDANPTSQYSFEHEWADWVQITTAILTVVTCGLVGWFFVSTLSAIRQIITAINNPQAAALEKISALIQK